jgi:hypothetical protein
MNWHSIPAAFRACRALNWSPLPLDPDSKKPRFYSWPRCCVVPLSNDELQGLYRPGCEIGVACGYGGLVIADVDRGADAARKLLHEMWGPPVAVVLGGRPDGFKAIYRGPWAEPPPELVRAALNYSTAGHFLARTTGALNKARQAAPDSMTVVSAEGAHTEAEARHGEAEQVFRKLQDGWIEAHRLIRSAKANADGIALEILAFGRVAVLPPSKHKDGVHTYRWEGDCP